MGTSFDCIKCNYPLPDEEHQHRSFQTKSLLHNMYQFTITKEGRLIWHRREQVDLDFVHDGEVTFYGVTQSKVDSLKSEWIEYTATFKDGNLVSIKRTDFLNPNRDLEEKLDKEGDDV